MVYQPSNHPQRLNVTNSMARLKNSHTIKTLTQNCEPQRYSWACKTRRTKHLHGKDVVDQQSAHEKDAVCQPSNTHRKDVMYHPSNPNGKDMVYQSSKLNGKDMVYQSSSLHGKAVVYQQSDPYGRDVIYQLSNVHGKDSLPTKRPTWESSC